MKSKTNTSRNSQRSKSRRWLTALPEKVQQKVFEELLECATPIERIPESFLRQKGLVDKALGDGATYRLYWLQDFHVAADALVTTFPKDVLNRMNFFNEKSKLNLKNKPLLVAVRKAGHIKAVIACSNQGGVWEEVVLCQERETAFLLNESYLDTSPRDRPLYIADDLISTLQLDAMGHPTVGLLGNWQPPTEKLHGRCLAVATRQTSTPGRGVSSTSWKLRQQGLPFEVVDRAKLDVQWILRSAQGELGDRKPGFWQVTLEKFFGRIRRGVLKLNLSSKSCETC